MPYEPEQHNPVSRDRRGRDKPIKRFITRTDFVKSHGNFPGQTHYTLLSANRGEPRHKQMKGMYEKRVLGYALVRPYSVLKRALSFKDFLQKLSKIVDGLEDVNFREEELRPNEIEMLKHNTGEFQ